MNDQFRPEKYFNISLIDEKIGDIFARHERVWDVLGGIDSYLAFLFENKEIEGNYSENVFVASNAYIDTTARIMGPAYIGDNAHIGFQAFIRPNVIVCSHTKIGHASEIKNSIILSKSAVAHFNYVGDSIVGSHVNIAAGAALANYRLDKKEILLKVGSEVINTGLSKFGAVIGDHSSIGVNAVLNPGTILGRNTVVYPLISVKGLHTDNEVLR